MILTIPQMQRLEKKAFEQGVSPESLMEKAGEGIARVIQQFFPKPREVLVYCGKGKNTGDALLAAWYLLAAQWRVLLRLTVPRENMGAEVLALLLKLEKEKGVTLLESPPLLLRTPLLIDGLLGLGSRGAPRGAIKEAIQEINVLRHEQNAFVVAVDLPSGLHGTTGRAAATCVQADLTVTIGFAKTGLLVDEATKYVGRLAVVELPELSKPHASSVRMLTASSLRKLLPPRSFDVHKGLLGHVGILAGSRGYLGAAWLASRAALSAGAGLVTLYALPDIYEMLACSSAPEVMVKPIEKYTDLLDEPLRALALGPGLGLQHREAIVEIIERLRIPSVIDADALNALAEYPSSLLKSQAPRLLTPHPGEMERLFPRLARSRAQWAEDFIKEYPVTLLLKGARTIIAENHLPLCYNTTGHPGMATGGMGDVLTGVLSAFLAAGHTCWSAARLGAWLCGRSAEYAIYHSNSSGESLVARDIIEHLGEAFKSLRALEY